MNSPMSQSPLHQNERITQSSSNNNNNITGSESSSPPQGIVPQLLDFDHSHSTISQNKNNKKKNFIKISILGEIYTVEKTHIVKSPYAKSAQNFI